MSKRSGFFCCVCVFVAMSVSGCGKPEPVIGLEFPPLPPTRTVAGPGFSVDVVEDWTAVTEGNKLICFPPEGKKVATVSFELTPYAIGETAATALDATEKERRQLKSHFIRRTQMAGFPGLKQGSARVKNVPSLDFMYFMLVTPSGRFTANSEFRDSNATISYLQAFERTARSIKLK